MIWVRGAFVDRDRRSLMSIIYFTLAAVALYLLSDWILERVEVTAVARVLQHPVDVGNDQFRAHQSPSRQY